MKILILILLSLTITLTLYCQDSLKSDLRFKKKNSIQAELFGNGFYLGSINYERIIVNGEKCKTAGQIGVIYNTGEFSTMLVINEIISFNSNHIETGCGIIHEKGAPSFFTVSGFSPRIGYRFQKPSGHFVFKIAWTPIFGLSKNNIDKETEFTRKLFYWGGLAMGYCF